MKRPSHFENQMKKVLVGSRSKAPWGYSNEIGDADLLALLNVPYVRRTKEETFQTQASRQLKRLLFYAQDLSEAIERERVEMTQESARQLANALSRFNHTMARSMLIPALRVEQKGNTQGFTMGFVGVHADKLQHPAAAGRLVEFILKDELWRIKLCRPCQKLFLAERQTAKFCSEACRQKAFSQDDVVKAERRAYNRKYYLDHVKGGKALIGKRPPLKKTGKPEPGRRKTAGV